MNTQLPPIKAKPPILAPKTIPRFIKAENNDIIEPRNSGTCSKVRLKKAVIRKPETTVPISTTPNETHIEGTKTYEIETSPTITHPYTDIVFLPNRFTKRPPDSVPSIFRRFDAETIIVAQLNGIAN